MNTAGGLATNEQREHDPMTGRLTRENLHGVWAAMATPFSDDGRLDLGILRENVRRLHAGGVHGIYTTDADGEFYALEIDEFRALVTAFGEECRSLGVPSQVGCTWLHTAGVVERLRICADVGVLGAHVGHPVFIPMNRPSLMEFWRDLTAAVPDWFAFIHYNTPRCPNLLRGADYAELASSVPNLVGVKLVGSDFAEFVDAVSHAPDLSFFVSEQVFAPFFPYGARGIYSWFANMNAPYLCDWYDELESGDWSAAARRQRRLNEFSTAAQDLRAEGNMHAVLNKARAAASDFLVPSNRTRAPYLAVSDDRVAEFRSMVEKEFSDLVWRPVDTQP